MGKSSVDEPEIKSRPGGSKISSLIADPRDCSVNRTDEFESDSADFHHHYPVRVRHRNSHRCTAKIKADLKLNANDLAMQDSALHNYIYPST